jgi:TetR/AcrR family transcriptional regulator, transcriptional repressor for nem operon
MLPKLTLLDSGSPVSAFAAEIGIKSASVHYYFATKDDLGAAIVDRYVERFLARLGDPERFHGDRKKIVAALKRLCLEALRADRMCLCGMLGVEFASLPEKSATATKAFFTRVTDWISTALSCEGGMGRKEAERQSQQILATLEGAMLLARVRGDFGILQAVS